MIIDRSPICWVWYKYIYMKWYFVDLHIDTKYAIHSVCIWYITIEILYCKWMKIIPTYVTSNLSQSYCRLLAISQKGYVLNNEWWVTLSTKHIGNPSVTRASLPLEPINQRKGLVLSLDRFTHMQLMCNYNSAIRHQNETNYTECCVAHMLCNFQVLHHLWEEEWLIAWTNMSKANHPVIGISSTSIFQL